MPRKQPVPTDLAIAKLAKPPEFETVKYKLPKPLLTNLQAYGECYREVRGEGIEPDVLVGLILEAHLHKDRAFAAWLKKAGRALAR